MNDISEHGLKEKIVKANEQSIVSLASDFEEKRFKNGDIKANSYVRLKQTIKTVGTYKFANIPIQKVTRSQVEKFLQNERVKADETIKKEFRLVKNTFALAVKKKLITENFFVGAEPITRPRSFQQSEKVEALTRKEEYLLTEYLKKHYSQYKYIILLALYTRNEDWGNSSSDAGRHYLG